MAQGKRQMLKVGTKLEKNRASEAENPLLDTLFLASSLSDLHFTLHVLTVHQYAQELRFPPIIQRTFLVAFPTLTFAIHLFHGCLFPRAFHSLADISLNGVNVMQQAIDGFTKIPSLVAPRLNWATRSGFTLSFRTFCWSLLT